MCLAAVPAFLLVLFAQSYNETHFQKLHHSRHWNGATGMSKPALRLSDLLKAKQNKTQTNHLSRDDCPRVT